TGKQLNIGAGQNRAEAANALSTDARLDHPEAAVPGQQRQGTRVHADFGNGAAVVVRQAYGLDVSDFDAVDLDRRVAGFQPFGGGQSQRDFRAAAEKILIHQPATDQRRRDRNQPYRRNTGTVFYRSFFVV